MGVLRHLWGDTRRSGHEVWRSESRAIGHDEISSLIYSIANNIVEEEISDHVKATSYDCTHLKSILTDQVIRNRHTAWVSAPKPDPQNNRVKP